MIPVLAAEGGYQAFELGGAEWFWLIFSAVTALLALAIGFLLMKGVLASDAGTPKMQEIAAAIQEGASAYLRRQFKTIAVIVIPLAIIVFLGAFIPLVGATVAGVLAALVALVANGPIVALIVVAVVIAVNQLEGDLLQPIVMGKSLQLHALVILFALTAGTILAGIIGAVLAVPLAAVVWAVLQVWTAEDPRVEDLNPDLPAAGSEPV